MKCTHDRVTRLVEQDGMVADGFCPICAQEQLAQAAKVFEAAERYIKCIEFYFPISKEYPDCVDTGDELKNAIAKFKGGQDDE